MTVKDAVDSGPSTDFSWVSKPPYLGLLAYFTVGIWTPLAHAIMVVHDSILTGGALYLSASLIGLVGFILIFIGFKKDELSATCLGFMGGNLIWLGWFEHGFHLFAELFDPAPVQWQGIDILSPELQIIQSSAILYLAVLLFLGFNKDTRCRMFKWFHRNAKLKPEVPTVGYVRQYSRITAMETVFIAWFFYIFIITLFDPRILGPFHPITQTVFYGFIVWGLYLLFFKMLQQRDMAFAIRYAIPANAVLWLCFEMASAWGWYTEIWVKPFEYPISNLVMLALFIGGGILLNMTARRGFVPKTA